MTPLDWAIVAILNGSVVLLGFYLARGTSSSSEWFLGSRALPWWAIGLSMFATNVDNADLVSVTGSTFSNGLHIISVYALGSAVGGILAAFVVVPTIYRAGFYTNAEYLESRFGPATRALSALIQIQYRGSMLGLMIWSAYLLLTRLVNIEPFWAWSLIVGLVVLSGAYTAWGGLKSVVWTDAAQGIVMMIAAFIIFQGVWAAAGGWQGMSQSLDSHGEESLLHIGQYYGDNQLTPPVIVVLGWTIIGSGYWTVNHTQTMRLMGSRSFWDMKMAAIWGVLLSLPVMCISAVLGVLAKSIPEFREVSEPDTLYPLLANRYLQPGLLGLVVAGVVAAVTSTFDSMGSALSAIFTRDLYARFLVRDKPDSHYVFVGRLATIAVLAVGFLYLPFIWRHDHMIKAFTTLIPVFVTPLFTVYLAGVLTAVHRRSGLIGLMIGSLYGLLALIDREFVDLTVLPEWFTNRWGALCWSFLITSVAVGISSTICKVCWPEEADRLEDSRDMKSGGWLARSRETLPPLRDHPFAGEVPWLFRPGGWAILSLLASAYAVFVVFW